MLRKVEQVLRKQILDLQDLRQAGLTSFGEVERFEKDRRERVCPSFSAKAVRLGALTIA